MRRVILESPFAGNLWGRWRNRGYARRCLRDSVLRGEAPLVSHLLYTQALDDADPYERKMRTLPRTSFRSLRAWLFAR